MEPGSLEPGILSDASASGGVNEESRDDEVASVKIRHNHTTEWGPRDPSLALASPRKRPLRIPVSEVTSLTASFARICRAQTNL